MTLLSRVEALTGPESTAMTQERLDEIQALADTLSDSRTCMFCGHDPYEYVDIGVGCVPVAVTCCDHGIGLYQHNDKGLARASGHLSEAAWAITQLLAVLRAKEGT